MTLQAAPSKLFLFKVHVGIVWSCLFFRGVQQRLSGTFLGVDPFQAWVAGVRIGTEAQTRFLLDERELGTNFLRGQETSDYRLGPRPDTPPTSLREEQTLHKRLTVCGHQVCGCFQGARFAVSGNCVPTLVTSIWPFTGVPAQLIELGVARNTNLLAWVVYLWCWLCLFYCYMKDYCQWATYRKLHSLAK